ncbi:hypothetical protein HYFRA_00003854 [Hymenoscyphus fraxineus]|uniref:Uncharacterized protein n=1 Tax=Hymenoscyphus fraxineus TaxID=746836 RepID=A0A9N9KZR4_9HELO|nr:hypothetical protein HYFRA_00003854 [Hymenoscyphus fraxineus]
MSTLDIVVIGAGLSGLAFTRFYLDIHPQTKIVILEADDCLGGVWSSSRNYDEFWSQSGQRMTGFSDTPLKVPSEAPLFHDTFEAKYVTQYLENYADNHVYDGATLRSRILFQHMVRNVEKIDGNWIVHADDASQIQQYFKSPKLVVATGHTSIPNMPSFPNQDKFGAPILHHKGFGKASHSDLANPSCNNVTVLGGGKSSVDMVYQSVKKGKNVSWVIRKSGEGPALFFPATATGRYRNSVESSATRYKQSFSPSSFMPNFCLRRWFHQSHYGTSYMEKMVENNDEHCRAPAEYHNRKGALPGFELLDFTTSAFWFTGPLGLAQHDDFWDVIAQNVHVYRADIKSMESGVIVLEDGIEIQSDALLCGTGWKSNYPFFSSAQVAALGLPRALEGSDQESETWKTLLERADKKVVANFPQLGNPPPFLKRAAATTAKLFKGIAPLEDNSIAFLGHINISNSFRVADAQAIWATAYFDGSINLPPLKEMTEEVAYMNAFSKRRYPSQGQKGDCLFFELVWYTDNLLEDVGLKSHRKGWYLDWVEPCLAADLEGAVNEYKKIYGF